MIKFIRASAGTGKTHTLLNSIFKYDEKNVPQVSYDGAVADINKSVFLTFTHLATEEIRSRIYASLSQCKGFEKDANMADQIFSTQLNVRVSTIHAFALDIIRLFRYKLGLPAEMNFAEEKDSLWAHSVDEYFAKYWDRAILKQRWGLTEREDIALFDFFFTLSNSKNVKAFIKEKGSQLFFLEELGKSSAYDVPANRAGIKSELAALGITPSADYKDILTNFKSQLADTKQSVKTETLKKVCPLLSKCSYFIDKMVVDIGTGLYLPYMFKNGLFDFDAVVYLLVRYIADSGIKCFYDELKQENADFNFLYIDEAQDNDVIQNYLIILFDAADIPVEVTVVGDLKQSIYAWRDSYPEEFAKMLKENESTLDHSKNAVAPLQESFRIKSDQTLQTVNGICDGIKAEENYRSWWYEPEKDVLRAPQDKPLTFPAQIALWSCANQKTFSVQQEEELKKLLQNGHNAVLVRNRSDLLRVGGLTDLLREIRANYRVPTNLRDKSELAPEMNFIQIFFSALTENLVRNVPFLLFWAEAGRIIKEQFASVPDGKHIADQLKIIFESIYEDVRTRNIENRIEYLFVLLDKYKIWRYFKHQGLTLSLAEVRRNICYVLTNAYLAEKRSNLSDGFLTDIPADILSKGAFPLDTYTLDKTNTSTEVVTIHGSKGLTYDNIVIVADFENSFFGQYENMSLSKYISQYSTLFNIDFEQILTKNPQFKISYFPYLGTEPAKVLKGDAKTKKPPVELWEGSLALYNNIKNLIMQECLNLLYVALTRARKSIILLDVGKRNFITQLVERGALPCVQLATVNEEYGTMPLANSLQVGYQENEDSYDAMMLTPVLKMQSVRSEVDKMSRRYGQALDSLQRLAHIKTGSMVHNALQRLVGKTTSPEEMTAQARAWQGNTADPLRAQAATIVCKNQAILKQCGEFWQREYTFFHEVPLWHFNTREKVLVKGSVDTVGIKDDTMIIWEYKVLFDGKDSQGKLAEAQLNEYKQILLNLYPTLNIETRYVALRQEE